MILINALKAITRSKGRSILVLLIVAAIGAAASVSLAIRQSAAQTEAAGLAQLTITGSIQVDRQKVLASAGLGTPGPNTNNVDIRQLLSQYPPLGLDQLQGYADSTYVTDFRYAESVSVNGNDALKPVTADPTNPTATPSPGRNGTTGTNTAGGPPAYGGRGSGSFTLTGYGSQSAMTGFASGTQRISTGSMIDLTKADNTCLISDDLASLDSLAVGDKITITNPAAATETYELTIAGTYSSTATTDNTYAGGRTAQDPANQILASYPTVTAILSHSATVATQTTDAQGQTVSTGLGGNLSALYVFANVADYEAFGTDLTLMGLDPNYTLSSADLRAYQASVAPLQSLVDFATKLLWIVLAVGAVVLVGVTVLTIRERKYEVGVMTAIGIHKPAVALQFVAEMVVVTLLGLVVGVAAGAVSSVAVANSLLGAQIAQAQTAGGGSGRPPMGGGYPGQTGQGRGVFSRTVDYISQINATIDWSVIAQLAGIGLALAIIASAAGVILVMRYEPLTILANRS